jgi:hypothetical protein
MNAMYIKKTSMALALGLMVLSVARIGRAVDSQQAQDGVARVASLFSSKSSVATVNMQISNEDGQHALSMKIWSEGDKVLVRITSPQDEAGTAVLKEGSDIRY